MSTGTKIIVDENINCYTAFEQWIKIMKNTKKKVTVNDKFLIVDVLLIFQRICVLKAIDERRIAEDWHKLSTSTWSFHSGWSGLIEDE